MSIDYLALLRSKSDLKTPIERTAKTAKTPESQFTQFIQSTVGGKRITSSVPSVDPVKPGDLAIDAPATDPDVHQRWTVAIPGRDVFGVIVPQGITLAQMRVQYPTAIAIRPTKQDLDPEITGAEQR